MEKTGQPRATVLVEWSAGGQKGVLIHADRYRDTWILPGGGLEQYSDGKLELPMAAAVRELVEETALEVEELRALFTHEGARRTHHVFQARVVGKLNKIISSKEAPAFAVCGPDLTPHVFLCEKGYATDKLKLSYSTRDILRRYYGLSETAAAAPVRVTAAVAAPPAPARPAPRIVADTPGALLRVAVGASILELTDGDIVQQDVDAVVNAANEHLADGAGVAGAIFKAAGRSELQAACSRLGGCPTGQAKITPGFKLKARHIIHAVGPVYNKARPEESDKLLTGAYRSSLELLTQHGLRSVAFPSISTGIFGFPVERAAPLALQTALDYLRDHQEIQLVRFVLWKENLAIYSGALKRLLGSG